MDNIKNFFKKKKMDVKFKQAGHGHSLTAQQQRQLPHRQPPPITRHGPPETSQRAAAAAMERLSSTKAPPKPTRSQQTIRSQAMRELERDSLAFGVKVDGNAGVVSNTPEISHAPLLVEGVFYTCELLSEDIILPKELMAEAIEQFLNEQFTEEPVVTSVLMIYSLCTQRDTRVTCIETLAKYIENIIDNPNQLKYRRIRVGNKAFQERVLSVAGGKEFLLAVGFKEKMVSVTEGGGAEPYMVLEGDLDIAHMQQAKQTLLEGEGVPIRIYRNPQILLEGAPALSQCRVPDQFFALSSEEIKKEQAAKTNTVDKLETLRTREMREKEGYKPRYKYVLIRIRFPDKKFLQGTFGSTEPFSCVRDFVREHLEHAWAPFSLKCVGKEIGDDADDKNLGQLQLAPAALLQFDMEASIVAQITESMKGMSIKYLKLN